MFICLARRLHEVTLGVHVQKTYLFTIWLYSQLQNPGSNCCCCCCFKFTVKTAFKGYLYARYRLQEKEAKHLGELEGGKGGVSRMGVCASLLQVRSIGSSSFSLNEYMLCLATIFLLLPFHSRKLTCRSC